jgi:hypothetical protein
MKQHNNLSIGMLISLCSLIIGAIYLSSPGEAAAQVVPKVTGELSAARQTTVNGTAAVSGLTVFNNSRVKTAGQGTATINLGKRGRIELRSETDLTLRLSPGAIGGDLRKGRALLSAPGGIAIAVMTAKGVVTTEGLKPAAISVEIAGNRAVVVALQGEAKIVSGGQVETVSAGEEVSLNPQSQRWQHRQLIAAGVAGGGAIGAAGAIQTAGQAANQAVVGARTVTVANLINASLNYTLVKLLATERDPEMFFDTTITCRDHDNALCRRRSGVNP